MMGTHISFLLVQDDVSCPLKIHTMRSHPFGCDLFCIIDNMETKSKVRICPFCGHHGHNLLHFNVNVRDEDGLVEIHDIWQMECKCCGARGPTECEPRFAVESWNIIHRKPAHDDDPMEDDFVYDPDLIQAKEKENTKNG